MNNVFCFLSYVSNFVKFVNWSILSIHKKQVELKILIQSPGDLVADFQEVATIDS